MNFDQLKQNLYHRVQLLPVACTVDADGRLFDRVDNDWIITALTGIGVVIGVGLISLPKVPLGMGYFFAAAEAIPVRLIEYK